MTTTKTEKSHDADTDTVVTQQLPKTEPKTSHAGLLTRPSHQVLNSACPSGAIQLIHAATLAGAVLCLPQDSAPSLPD